MSLGKQEAEWLTNELRNKSRYIFSHEEVVTLLDLPIDTSPEEVLSSINIEIKKYPILVFYMVRKYKLLYYIFDNEEDSIIAECIPCISCNRFGCTRLYEFIIDYVEKNGMPIRGTCCICAGHELCITCPTLLDENFTPKYLAHWTIYEYAINIIKGHKIKESLKYSPGACSLTEKIQSSPNGSVGIIFYSKNLLEKNSGNRIWDSFEAEDARMRLDELEWEFESPIRFRYDDIALVRINTAGDIQEDKSLLENLVNLLRSLNIKYMIDKVLRR